MAEAEYDLIIIGGGPAGYTAALYAVRAGIKTVVLERLTAGGQMALTERIDNYPGFPETVDGIALGEQMRKGAERAGAETVFTEVQKADLSQSPKVLETDSGTYYGKSVILATGANPRKLGVPGEEALTGQGVSYCAVCDGMFYKGRVVAVIGGGNSAASDALHLAGICEKVYLIHRRDQLRASADSVDKIQKTEKIEILWNSQVTQIHGENAVTGITLQDTQTGEKMEIPCNGVFVAVGREPASALFAGQLPQDTSGYLITNDDMETRIPGVFAAGDVRAKQLRQIITAAADGAIAAEAAERFLRGLY